MLCFAFLKNKLSIVSLLLKGSQYSRSTNLALCGGAQCLSLDSDSVQVSLPLFAG